MTKKEFEKLLGDFIHDNGNFWAYLSTWILLVERNGLKDGDLEELIRVVNKHKNNGLQKKPNEIWRAFENLED